MIPEMKVPGKWEAELSEEEVAEINSVKDHKTRKVLYRLGMLFKAVNFVLERQVEVTKYLIKMAEMLNKINIERFWAHQSKKQVRWYWSGLKWALILVLAGMLNNLAGLIWVKLGGGKP